MTVTHSLGDTRRTTKVGRSGLAALRLRERARLLHPEWRQARWMLNNTSLCLTTTLEEAQFTDWLLGVAGRGAVAAAGAFEHQSPEARQMLAMLVRYFRFGRRPPTWATQFWQHATT